MTLSVDHPLRGTCAAGLNCNDPVASDHNIRPARWRTGAINDVAVLDQEVHRNPWVAPIKCR